MHTIRDLLVDLRVGSRSLFRQVGFTAIAVLTLALGLGATTAIFSVVYGVLLQPLPYPGADRVVSVVTEWTRTGRVTPRLSGGDYVDARQQADALQAVSFYYGGEIGVRTRTRAEMTGTWFVTTRFFDVFGVRAAHGRTFTAGDEARAAVVTLAWARGQFGSGAAAIGEAIDVDGITYQIVGVMPPAFGFPERASVWLPVEAEPENLNRTAFNYPTVARIRAERTVEAARAQLTTISDRLARTHPDSNRDKRLTLVPLQERLVGGSRATLLLLMGAVVVLLLIACVNVANLLLARASARRRELAVRAALGASRWRLLRQLLLENLLLATAGGVLGVALAWASLGLLVRLAPADVPRLGEVRIQPVVLAFAAAVTWVASLVFGLLPAWQAARVDLRAQLASAGTRGVVGGGSIRLRRWLTVAELALAVVLAVSAGLLVRSFLRVAGDELGFHTAGVLIVQAHLPTRDAADLERAADRFERLFPELAALPGVEAVSAGVGLPLGPLGSHGAYAVEGLHTFAPGQQLPQARFRLTSPGYFETLGIRLKAGRDFRSGDRTGSGMVAVISASIAAEVFGEADPIGRRVQCGLDSLEFMTIVGVVEDVRDTPGGAPSADLYMPLAQHTSRAGLVEIVIRTSVDPASVAEPARARIARHEPEISTKIVPMSALAAGAVATPRFRAWLVGVFAAVAVLLAMAGVFGVMSYLTAQRTEEFGVRLALGARPADVLRLVLRETLAIAVAGLSAGVLLSLAASRLLESVLVGVSGADVPTHLAVLGSLTATTLAASAVPVWRAGRVDPARVLRSE